MVRFYSQAVISYCFIRRAGPLQISYGLEYASRNECVFSSNCIIIYSFTTSDFYYLFVSAPSSRWPLSRQASKHYANAVFASNQLSLNRLSSMVASLYIHNNIYLQFDIRFVYVTEGVL